MPEAYQYSSEPRVITSKRLRRPKANQPVGPSANIMWDKRVVRGSTCTGVKNAEIVKAIQEEAEREAEEEARRAKKEQRRRDKQLELAKAVEAAAAAAAQAELEAARLAPDLIELDRPVEPDEPIGYEPLPPPVFVAAVGVNEVSTQSESTFFVDFDLEVQPLLQVIVGKTMQLAFNEVIEEEEQDAKEISANDFDIVRNIELAEKQRLEEARTRKELEKARRDAEQSSREIEEARAHMRTQAQNVAKAHLEGIRGEVFDRLSVHNVFEDPVPSEIERLFYPVLFEKMQKDADRMARATEICNVACEAALDQGMLVHRADIARAQLKQGWAEQDFSLFDKGFKEITTLGLTQEVNEYRQQFGVLHKAYSEQKFKDDMAASKAAIKKYYGRAEKEGAKLVGSALSKLEKLLVEAEALGELEHVWRARVRLAAIRVRADAALLAAEQQKQDADQKEWNKAVAAGESWCAEEQSLFSGDETAVRPKLTADATPVLALYHKIEAEEEEPAAEEEETAAEEEEGAEGEQEPEQEKPEEKKGPIILNANQVHGMGLGSEADYITAAKLVAEHAPALLQRALGKFDPSSGACLLQLFSSLSVSSSVLVDFRVPYSQDTPTHAHCADPPEVLWPALLQKGLSKALGGWDQLCNASVSELLHMITGAAAVEIDTRGLLSSPQRDCEPDKKIEPCEMSNKLWTTVAERHSQEFLQVCRVKQERWGLSPGVCYPILHVATVPHEILYPPEAPPEEEPTEGEDPVEEEEEKEPMVAQLVCLRVPEGTQVQGSLTNPDGTPWPEGLVDGLTEVMEDPASTPDTVWLTVPELLHAVDSIVGLKSSEQLRLPDPEQEEYQEEQLVCRRQALGSWHSGSAFGSNCHFELLSPEDSTVVLTASSESDAQFEIRVLPPGVTFKHGAPTGCVEGTVIAASSGRVAGTQVQLSASAEPRMVVVSHRTAGEVGGAFVLSATSTNGSIELKQRPMPVTEDTTLQRYDHRWKGNTAGGPPSDPQTWRNNPVWRVTPEIGPCTLAAVLEQDCDAAPVCLRVLRNTDEAFTSTVTPTVNMLAESELSDAPEVAVEIPLESAVLVVPGCAVAGTTQEYRMHLVSDNDIKVELLPAAQWQSCNGSWRNSTCGGAEPEQLARWLSNPQFRLRLDGNTKTAHVCVTMSQVTVEPKLKPPPEPEVIEEDPEAEGDTPAEGEEGAEAEEEGASSEERAEGEEEEKDKEVVLEYEDQPGYGFSIVQNPADSTPEAVVEGFTVLSTIQELAMEGEVTLSFDADLSAGGALFVVPFLSQTARVGEYKIGALAAEGVVHLEPTPGTRQAMLAPPTPEPTPPPTPGPPEEAEEEDAAGEEAEQTE